MNDATLRVLIEETVSRAISKIRVPSLRPGTVTSVVGPMVLVDGDESPVEVPSLVGSVVVGWRVMVMFHPPAGAVIIGRISTS
jgi:hypothetical protein